MQIFYTVVHVNDDVNTIFCTAVCKPISQQGSEHTVLPHSQFENQQGEALPAFTTSDVMLSYKADHRCCDEGKKINEKKTSFTYVVHSFDMSAGSVLLRW